MYMYWWIKISASVIYLVIVQDNSTIKACRYCTWWFITGLIGHTVTTSTRTSVLLQDTRHLWWNKKHVQQKKNYLPLCLKLHQGLKRQKHNFMSPSGLDISLVLLVSVYFVQTPRRIRKSQPSIYGVFKTQETILVHTGQGYTCLPSGK